MQWKRWNKEEMQQLDGLQAAAADSLGASYSQHTLRDRGSGVSSAMADTLHTSRALQDRMNTADAPPSELVPGSATSTFTTQLDALLSSLRANGRVDDFMRSETELVLLHEPEPDVHPLGPVTQRIALPHAVQQHSGASDTDSCEVVEPGARSAHCSGGFEGDSHVGNSPPKPTRTLTYDVEDQDAMAPPIQLPRKAALPLDSDWDE